MSPSWMLLCGLLVLRHGRGDLRHLRQRRSGTSIGRQCLLRAQHLAHYDSTWHDCATNSTGGIVETAPFSCCCGGMK
eukprot:scaffold158956_cov30-Tisochrysis_lutea.AAC.5